MHYLAIAAASLTFLVSLFSVFLSLRAELKKNTERILQSKIDEERRHAFHEQNITQIKDRIDFIQNSFSGKLDEIHHRISEITKLLFIYSKGDYDE